jgi:hypothetical protein
VHGALLPELHYVALCVTGCAGIAVLGARRPGVGPWNFVVAALLSILLLPFLESWVTGKALHLDAVRAIFLGATLAVGVVNYLPTRLALPAVVLAVEYVCEIGFLFAPVHGFSVTGEQPPLLDAWPGLVPWIALVCIGSAGPPASEFDRLWLDFRNRFGFWWSQRLREQFNRSAYHSGWPVILRWQGLRLRPGTALPEPAVQEELLATLHALMKRFGPDI